MPAPASAVISECGRYRYVLTRRWCNDGDPLMFVMLNPSTADAEQDDPTIRKCIGFARRHAYPGIVVCNLFAWRATDPKDLHRALLRGEDIIGPINHDYLVGQAETAADIVLAWGAHADDHQAVVGGLLGTLHEYRAKFRTLGVTKWGHPRHPLMVPYSQPLERYQ